MTTAEAREELEVLAEFQRAWHEPRYQRFELPATDLNQILGERYWTSRPLTLTRTMLWDIEARKARAPDRYIPGLVEQHTACVWAQRTTLAPAEFFLRASRQRLWRTPSEHATILERVHLDPSSHTATFLGVRDLPDSNGASLVADTRRPLFHVQHWGSGPEHRPLSRWRIVHLTDTPDEALAQRFASMHDGWLPEFVEIFIQDDLGIDLSRRQDS